MNTLIVAALCSFVAVASASGILGGGAILAAPSASAVISGPALGLGGLGLGGVALGGVGLGGVGLGGLGLGGVGLAAPVLATAGVGAITNGGGAIAATGHGAAIRGPPTAPVVVAGPSGKIAADGLWGPTANIGVAPWGSVGKAW